MQFDFDFEELATRMGIGEDRLRKNLATYSAMSELFPLLETTGCQVGLFGGTALNKIYFGMRQRLSYDLDIFAYSYRKTLAALGEKGAQMKFEGAFPKRKGLVSARFEYNSIILDVVDAAGIAEKPLKLQAFDLLYYYNQLVPPVVVPSYALGYLLAEKTMALLDRNELKDIYDTWNGMKLLKDVKQYVRSLRKAAKARGIKDIGMHADFQITNMLQNVGYYAKRQIEITDKSASTQEMLKDIKAFLDMHT